MAESDEHRASKYPELEARRNRPAAYGEEPARADKPRDNTAFYRIEREAIQLRRLRWETGEEQSQRSEQIDREAASRAGHWHLVRSRQHLSDDAPLAQYARPPAKVEKEPMRMVDRVRRWFRSAP